MRNARFPSMTACMALLYLGGQVLSACSEAAPSDGSPPPESVTSAAPISKKESPLPARLHARYLPNLFQLHDKVLSGGQPVGEQGFQELAELGVKTIISVDGARPDVAGAKKHGLRYVHLPHGYDGVPESRVQELGKAVRDLPGRIYIHCHHGKHRSPTAASVACVAAGLLDPAWAENVLRTAGTSDNYRGLYAAARDARRLDDSILDAIPATYPETATIPPLAEAMVQMEHIHDHLQSIAAAGWKSPPEHPDLVPDHEALLLREHFTELRRRERAQDHPAGFHDLLRKSEAAAGALEEALHRESAPRRLTAQAAFENVSRNCAACHQAYRDVPLGEK